MRKGHKSKNNKPKMCFCLGQSGAAPGERCPRPPGTREQMPVTTLFISTFRYYNKTLNDKRITSTIGGEERKQCSNWFDI